MKPTVKFVLPLLAVILISATSCSTLSVMSFNVRQSHAREDDSFNKWDNRADACLEMLRHSAPDLVGFQEAYFKGQWSFLSDRLSSTYSGYAVGRDDGKEKGEVTGYLYNKKKLVLLDNGTFWQSETPDLPSKCFRDQYNCPRSVSWALFKIKGTNRKFYYLNTHTAVDPYSQTLGFEVILSWLKDHNTKGYPVVLSGDLNMPPTSKVLDLLRRDMKDARVAAPADKTDNNNTYNAWGNDKKAAIIDYIWISESVKCLGYHTDTNEYGGHKLISDHYPISATLRF